MNFLILIPPAFVVYITQKVSKLGDKPGTMQNPAAVGEHTLPKPAGPAGHRDVAKQHPPHPASLASPLGELFPIWSALGPGLWLRSPWSIPTKGHPLLGTPLPLGTTYHS